MNGYSALRFYMDRKGVTAAELAEQAGCSVTTVKECCRRHSRLLKTDTVLWMKTFATVLDIPSDYILEKIPQKRLRLTRDVLQYIKKTKGPDSYAKFARRYELRCDIVRGESFVLTDSAKKTLKKLASMIPFFATPELTNRAQDKIRYTNKTLSVKKMIA